MTSESVQFVISVPTNDSEKLRRLFSLLKENDISFDAPYHGDPCIQGDNDLIYKDLVVSYIRAEDPITTLLPEDHVEDARYYMKENDNELDSVAGDIVSSVLSQVGCISSIIGVPLSLAVRELADNDDLCLATRPLNDDEIFLVQEANAWKAHTRIEDNDCVTSYTYENGCYVVCIHLQRCWENDSSIMTSMIRKRFQSE